ncbi:MAG: glucosaminidase domain-containing protein [Flavobacteriaceae bacterium]|nr:glucosaminidase domain-containing protein [Flavobacteriaceae bacterium]
MKKISILLIASLFLASCGSKRKTTTTKKPAKKEVIIDKPTNETPIKITPTIGIVSAKQKYINTYSNLAMEEMKLYKIPASIKLAQGILESSSGKSQLSARSNNHFGIKCHKGWKGGKTYHDDDEKGECFRVYKHPSYSFRDHSLFLYGRKRYMNLFRLKITDYKGWAKGLQKAGYATDKKYPKKLIKIIEENRLYEYDALALGKTVDEIKVKSKDSHIVKKGDTLYSISRKYKLSVAKLKEINGIDNNDISIGQKLYLTSLE